MDCERVVAEVVRAVEIFARAGTGAVIVFERTPLGSLVSESVPMNAELNTKVLLNNFQNARTRDGAIIVRGDRVIARSCRLPVSKLGKSAGGPGRRGALGVVEQSDAVVVLVTDSNGRVELGADGVLQPSAPAGLAARLRALLARGAPLQEVVELTGVDPAHLDAM